MRTLFSIQRLLTTLGMLEARRAAQEVAQQQNWVHDDQLAADSDRLALTKQIYEAHNAKIAKTEETERRTHHSSEWRNL